MVTRAWRVYGQEGHRQRTSFFKSMRWDFSKGGDIRIIEIDNVDKTGTNDYSLVRITRNTVEECEKELESQLSDGYWENYRYGNVEEVSVNG